MRIDLNCDLGEGFGVYGLGDDAALLQHVSSANIACGFHAGDPNIMRRTVRLALENQVAIGAHPGLPDLAGFGRRNMSVNATETRDLVLYQIGALEAFVRAEGGRLRHVKPHGALYNMAATQQELALAIAQAVAEFDQKLVLVGLAGSSLIEAGRAMGLSTAQEAFADRTYQSDGTLTSRRAAGAVLHDADAVVQQCLSIVQRGEVATVSGGTIPLRADTICVHGDTPGAAVLVATLRRELEQAGIEIRAGL